MIPGTLPAESVPTRRLLVLHAIGSISVARGGPSVALFNTIEALRAVGIDSEIVTTDDDGVDRRLELVGSGQLTVHRGVRTHFFPRQTRFYSASWPMLGWLRRHARRYDVVHVHALFNFAPGVAAAAAAAAGVPYVIRPAGVLGTWGREQRRPWLKQGSLRMIEGPLLRRAAAVQFTSESEREQAQDLPLPMRQPVIPLAVPLEPAAPEGVEDNGGLAVASLLRDEPWLLFLSRLDPKKGIERLLEAFASMRPLHRNVHLVIAGSGSPEYEASLQALGSRLRLDGHVHWTGFVDGARKRWLLSRCGAFVLPSASENFGVAAVEAMAAGRPVVVSSGVAVSEIVARWNAGIVTSLDPSDIAAALGRMLADRATANEQGRRGREAVATELSAATHGRRLAELYREILVARRGSRP